MGRAMSALSLANNCDVLRRGSFRAPFARLGGGAIEDGGRHSPPSMQRKFLSSNLIAELAGDNVSVPHGPETLY